MELKTGSSRKVFLIGKYAIKIPNFYSHKTFLNGCRDNWSERVFYRDFKGVYVKNIQGIVGEVDLTDLVAPSLFCSWFGFIQIQKRINPLDRQLTEEEKQKYQGVCTDLHKGNFGTFEGKLLCLDYAD